MATTGYNRRTLLSAIAATPLILAMPASAIGSNGSAGTMTNLIADYRRACEALNTAPRSQSVREDELLSDAFCDAYDRIFEYEPKNPDEFLRKMAILFEDGDPATEIVCERVWKDITRLLSS